MPLPDHPLRRWRKSKGYTTTELSELLRSTGVEFKPRSIIAVESGYRHPAYEVCEAIETLSGKVVSIAELRHWPLRPYQPQQ